MGYIFISYSHKDKQYVHLLAENLEQEGFNVWIDDRMDYGSDWPIEIQQRLDYCDALILIMSPRSIVSKWVQNELNRALRKGKPIFPLLLEGKEPWLAVESTQYVDVTSGRMPEEKFYERLALETVRKKKTVENEEPPPPESPAQPREAPATRKAALTIRQQKKPIFKSWGLPTAILTLFCVLAILGIALFVIPKLAAWFGPTPTPTPVPSTNQGFPTPTKPLSSKTPIPIPSFTPGKADNSPPIKTPTPAPETPGTPSPLQRYGLPFSKPEDIVSTSDGLWVLYGSRLVKLELVEEDKRFRAEKQIEFPEIKSLDWDSTTGQYWAICGPESCQGEIELIDQDGNLAATFTTPQTLEGNPIQIAWDGEYVWLTTQNGNLYKLQASPGTNELKLVDSFGLSLHWGLELHGLAWDGTAFWILDGDYLVKLDRSAQPVCEIQFPGTSGISWWEYLGITWDGHFLWVTHTGTSTIYRVDPALCGGG
jgi:hypothetical protein